MGVLIVFYRVGREVEVAEIGGAAAVNGFLNRVVTGVKEGEEMRPSKGGVMMGLTGRVHSMTREKGGAAALARRRARRRWCSAGTDEGGRGRPTGPGGPKWLNGLAGCWAVGLEAEKNHFKIKIVFLNLPWLWKFVQGDIGRILTQRFFLNSSRLLKDF
jgi:hypothetical protein